MMYKKDLISKYIIRLLTKQYDVDKIFDQCPRYFCLNKSIALSGATNIVFTVDDIKQYVIIRK